MRFLCISQNHRMFEVGRHLYKPSSPNTLLKRAQLLQVAQDYAQMGFEYLQAGRPHNLPGKPVPVFGHPHSKKTTFLIFRICAHRFLRCEWAPLRRAWLCLLYSSHLVFIHINKTPLSHLFCRLISLTSLSLSTYVRCSSTLTIFVALC